MSRRKTPYNHVYEGGGTACTRTRQPREAQSDKTEPFDALSLILKGSLDSSEHVS